MPNVTRGTDLAGLMRYLAGPGRSNEHTDPHLVAGDDAVMAWHHDEQLNRTAAEAIAAQLDDPRRAFGTEVAGGHVWHCSLSLRADEGQLSDEAWAAIARDVMDGMEFTGAGRAPVRWAAVRHGLSTNGNDHIHLVVNLVREDGTKANVYRDYKRVQTLAGQLEAKHGLVVLEERGAARGERGVTRPEIERAAREGRDEPHRRALGRVVRAAATAATDEAEFVRRLRRENVLVDGRIAAGTSDVITGYSVALRPVAGERPLYFGGGHLAKDLSLTRLRQAWPDSPQHAAAASAEWIAAKRGRRPVAPGPELAELSPQQWSELIAQQREVRSWLRGVPVEDRATWARVAGETAGAFAAWSRAVETTPGPLADAADTLARSAYVQTHATTRPPAGTPTGRGSALLLSSLARGGQGTVAQAVLLRQLSNTARAVYDAHQAVGEARRAEEIVRVMRGRLAEVRARLPELPQDAARRAAGGAPTVDREAAEALRISRIGQQPLRDDDLARGAGSPLPNRLQPDHRPPGVDQGPGRRRPEIER